MYHEQQPCNDNETWTTQQHTTDGDELPLYCRPTNIPKARDCAKRARVVAPLCHAQVCIVPWREPVPVPLWAKGHGRVAHLHPGPLLVLYRIDGGLQAHHAAQRGGQRVVVLKAHDHVHFGQLG